VARRQTRRSGPGAVNRGDHRISQCGNRRCPRCGNIAELSGDAIKKRGQFTFAVSGGTTPWLMLNHLAKLDIAWDKIHIFQVDERVAPSGDRSRNWTHLSETLLSQVKLPEAQTHGIPVNMTDLEAAAAHYSATLCSVAGTPAVLDLVHLGLGADGHTASLVSQRQSAFRSRCRCGRHRILSKSTARDADLPSD